MKKILSLFLPLVLFLILAIPAQALEYPKNDFSISEVPIFTFFSPNGKPPRVKIIREKNNEEVESEIYKTGSEVFRISLKDKTVVTGKYRLELLNPDVYASDADSSFEFNWGNGLPGSTFPKPSAGSFLALYFKEQPDQKGKQIIKTNTTSVHFREADGTIRGVFTPNPIFYKEGDEWEPIDNTLKDGEDEITASGIPIVINKDGVVIFKNTPFEEETISFGLYNPNTKIYKKIADLPQGQIKGNQYIMKTSDFSHVYTLGNPDGLVEELTFYQKPDLGQIIGKDSDDWLVMETEVKGLDLPDGWVTEPITLGSQTFPLPQTKQATGQNVFTKWFAQKVNNTQYLYTGIAAGMLNKLIYPITIDPDITSYAESTQGYIEGQSTNYNTAHTTAYNFANANGHHMWLGRAYLDAKGGPQYTIYRNFYSFDTSSIGSSGIVNNATLTTDCTGTGECSSAISFNVQILKYNWTSPLNSGNMQGNYTGCYNSYSDSNNNSNPVIWFTTGATGSPTSPNLDTAWINKTGSTFYCFKSSRDNGVANTANEWIWIQPGTNVDFPTRRTYLTVNYSTPTPTPTPTLVPAIKFNGVKMNGVKVN
ncbi:MAG: hypothetical protein M1268_04660 [Patescibacteria group bacterium]|nr:hypothetical protein [Patescibacteria group bacterium]